MDAQAFEQPVSVDTLARFARREREAFVEVHRAFAQDVFRWVSRFFASPFEQEEAVQEVWLTAHRMCGAYDLNRGPLAPWLRALALNRCKELLRAKGRRPQASDPVEAIDEAVAAPGPEAQVARSHALAAVECFAAGLPADEARVLREGLAAELTLEELAQRLSLTVRQCKYLKKKLLARAAQDEGLRAALRELQGGGA